MPDYWNENYGHQYERTACEEMLRRAKERVYASFCGFASSETHKIVGRNMVRKEIVDTFGNREWLRSHRNDILAIFPEDFTQFDEPTYKSIKEKLCAIVGQSNDKEFLQLLTFLKFTGFFALLKGNRIIRGPCPFLR